MVRPYLPSLPVSATDQSMARNSAFVIPDASAFLEAASVMAGDTSTPVMERTLFESASEYLPVPQPMSRTSVHDGSGCAMRMTRETNGSSSPGMGPSKVCTRPSQSLPSDGWKPSGLHLLSISPGSMGTPMQDADLTDCPVFRYHL